MNSNKERFTKLCRYIWRDNPDQFIAVRVNPVIADDDEQHTYRFAAPDKSELTGIVCMTEAGVLKLGQALGYASVIIIKQRGKHGRYVIPDPDQIERDKNADY